MAIRRITPGPGQESVWDYPRPPRVEVSRKQIQVVFNGVTIADSTRAMRVLETSHPPVYYIPPDDMHMEYFVPTQRATFCEFKGAAHYYTIAVNGRSVENSAWYYPRPSSGYEMMAGYVAVYPGSMDACFVDGERVQAQQGDFYGGWITGEIVGPFKGGPNTFGW